MNAPGSENVSACVSKVLAAEVSKLAAASSMNRSAYVRELLKDAVRKRRIFKVSVEIVNQSDTAK